MLPAQLVEAQLGPGKGTIPGGSKKTYLLIKKL